MKNMTRRDMLKGAAAGCAASLAAGQVASAADTCKAGELPEWKNEAFYKDGKFDAEAAKKAYFKLMAYHGFPIMDVLKTEEFWVLDFNLGKFTEVGMGGIFYVNNKRDDYLLHDIWLLPGQMIPEHYHVKYKDVAPKMEAWLVRHGRAYMYAEGKGSAEDEKRIPPSHKKCSIARKCVGSPKPGEVVRLEVPESRHFMVAGDEGAIVTEVATYHSMDALKFTHPKVSL